MIVSNFEELIRDLALGLDDAPHGKLSSADKLLHYTIHNLGLLRVVLFLILYGSPKMVMVMYRWPKMAANSLWADSFNALKLGRYFG